MNEQNIALIRGKFAEYYLKNTPTPPSVSEREFGFGWRDKIDFRHKAFKSETDLAQFFRIEAPLYASYSVARYEFPDAQPMPKKNYLGADLVFDLDTSYESEKHEHNPLLCEYCLERVKEDALRLKKEFLEGDFGFSTQEIAINFSGQKGYHIHVRSDAVQQYSKTARRELMSYIIYRPTIEEMLTKAKQTVHRGEKESKVETLTGPKYGDLGWKGKVYRTAKNIIFEATIENLKEYGVGKLRAEAIIDNKAEILQKLEEGNWEYIQGLEKLWERMFEKHAIKGIEVDQQVSFDTSRLIRLPESIHGSTGFLAKTITNENFKPWRDALAFTGSDYTEVTASEDATFTIGKETYSLRKDQITGLPEAAALFIICKGKAIPTINSP